MILALEQQVAPLALCQRLKALGAPQDSHFSWWLIEGPDEYQVGTAWEMAYSKELMDEKRAANGPDMPTINPVRQCAAYTVAEGLALAGPLCAIGQDNSDGGRWTATGGAMSGVLYDRDAATPAEAIALLLIALAEAGHVTWGRP